MKIPILCDYDTPAGERNGTERNGAKRYTDHHFIHGLEHNSSHESLNSFIKKKSNAECRIPNAERPRMKYNILFSNFKHLWLLIVECKCLFVA